MRDLRITLSGLGNLWSVALSAAVVVAVIGIEASPVGAVNFESYTTQTFAGPGSAGAFNVTTIPGFNRYLLVGYQHERAADPGNEIQTLTYGGVPLTLAHREVNTTA